MKANTLDFWKRILGFLHWKVSDQALTSSNLIRSLSKGGPNINPQILYSLL